MTASLIPKQLTSIEPFSARTWTTVVKDYTAFFPELLYLPGETISDALKRPALGELVLWDYLDTTTSGPLPAARTLKDSSFIDSGFQVIRSDDNMAAVVSGGSCVVMGSYVNMSGPITVPTSDIQTIPYDISPFVISTVQELQLIGRHPDYPSYGSYVLYNDIDASDTTSWNDGLGFIPLGTSSNPFTGTFDGCGYKITGLYINRPDDNRVGLFSYNKGVVKNVYLEDGSITGKNYTGSLVGYNYQGGIKFCYSTNDVVGENYSGGLIGQNAQGTVLSCYTACTISAGTRSGGLVGMNTGTISSCFSSSNITGTYYVGGVVGRNYGGILEYCYAVGAVSGTSWAGGIYGQSSGTVTDCFYDYQTTGQSSSGVGAKTTVQMKKEATFVNWDFDDMWEIVEDTSYPTLRFGLVSDLIQIANITDLQKIGNHILFPNDATYILTQNIDASVTSTWNSGEGFIPITNFSGILDGKGYKISNLYIDRNASSSALIMRNTGVIKYLVLEDSSITGYSYVADIACINEGYISNCQSSSGTINGHSYVGSISGYNLAGTIVNCVNSSEIIAEQAMGGISGVNLNGGIVYKCLSTGNISDGVVCGGLVGLCSNTSLVEFCMCACDISYTGSNPNSHIGGLIGWVSSADCTIRYCISSVNISADSGNNIGGIIGYNRGGLVDSCYAVGEIICSGAYVGGIVGQTYGGSSASYINTYYDYETTGQSSTAFGARSTSQMYQQSNYVSWDFVNVWEINEGLGYPSFISELDSYYLVIHPLDSLSNDLSFTTPDTFALSFIDTNDLEEFLTIYPNYRGAFCILANVKVDEFGQILNEENITYSNGFFWDRELMSYPPGPTLEYSINGGVIRDDGGWYEDWNID